MRGSPLNILMKVSARASASAGVFDRLTCTELAVDVLDRVNGDDVRSINCDRARADHAAGAVDRDDDAIGDEKRYLPRRLRRYARSAHKQEKGNGELLHSRNC